MYTEFFSALSPAKKAAYLAVFIALCVVTNSYLEIDISPSNKITFNYVLLFYAGFLLGPLPGFAVGFLGDAIGFILKPQDVYWFFGVTLGLIGVIAGLIRNLIPLKGRKGIYAKACIALSLCFVLITLLVNTLVNYSYLYLFIWGKVFKKAFWVYFAGRMAVQTIVFGVNFVLALVILPVFVSARSLRLFKEDSDPLGFGKTDSKQEQRICSEKDRSRSNCSREKRHEIIK